GGGVARGTPRVSATNRPAAVPVALRGPQAGLGRHGPGCGPRIHALSPRLISTCSSHWTANGTSPPLPSEERTCSASAPAMKPSKKSWTGLSTGPPRITCTRARTSWDGFHRAKYVPVTKPSLAASIAAAACASGESLITGSYGGAVRSGRLVAAGFLGRGRERRYDQRQSRTSVAVL